MIQRDIKILLIGIFVSFMLFYLQIDQSLKSSEKSFNYTLLSAMPVDLDVKHSYTINGSEGWLYINITNTHPFKRTGEVYLYKLEIDPDKPEMLNETGVGPSESKSYKLAFKSNKINISFESEEPYTVRIPSSKSQYAAKHASITYKITCDACPPQGIIRRIPSFRSTIYYFDLDVLNGMTNKVSMLIFEWVDYTIKDIKL